MVVVIGRGLEMVFDWALVSVVMLCITGGGQAGMHGCRGLAGEQAQNQQPDGKRG